MHVRRCLTTADTIDQHVLTLSTRSSPRMSSKFGAVAAKGRAGLTEKAGGALNASFAVGRGPYKSARGGLVAGASRGALAARAGNSTAANSKGKPSANGKGANSAVSFGGGLSRAIRWLAVVLCVVGCPFTATPFICTGEHHSEEDGMATP